MAVGLHSQKQKAAIPEVLTDGLGFHATAFRCLDALLGGALIRQGRPKQLSPREQRFHVDAEIRSPPSTDPHPGFWNVVGTSGILENVPGSAANLGTEPPTALAAVRSRVCTSAAVRFFGM